MFVPITVGVNCGLWTCLPEGCYQYLWLTIHI